MKSKRSKISVLFVAVTILIAIIGINFLHDKNDESHVNSENKKVDISQSITKDVNQILPDDTSSNKRSIKNGVSKNQTSNVTISKGADIDSVYREIAILYKHYDEKRFELKANNHSQLLSIYDSMIDSTNFNEELKNMSQETINEICLVLYKDALSTIVEEQNPTVEKTELINKSLDQKTISIKTLDSDSSHLSSDYLDQIKKVFTNSGCISDEESSVLEQKMAVIEMRSLYKQRKRYSDNYFRSIIKSYIYDSRIEFSDKITLAERIITTKDYDQINFIYRYFDELRNDNQIRDNQLHQVNKIMEKMNAAFK